MTIILRHRQVGITRVSPHPGNKRYAIPGGERGQVVGYPTDATYFNGVDSAVRRNTALTTAPVASKQGTFSTWFRVSGRDLEVRQIFSSSFRTPINYSGSNQLSIRMETSGNDEILNLTAVSEQYLDGVFHHLVASWDLAQGLWHFYVDDIEVNMAITNLTDDFIKYDHPNVNIGSNSAGVNIWQGCLGELYFNMTEYIDLDVEANRRKFITVAHNPADLGANGELPLTTLPTIYLKNGGRDGINQGTGGNFDQLDGALFKCTIPGPQV